MKDYGRGICLVGDLQLPRILSQMWRCFKYGYPPSRALPQTHNEGELLLDGPYLPFFLLHLSNCCAPWKMTESQGEHDNFNVTSSLSDLENWCLLWLLCNWRVQEKVLQTKMSKDHNLLFGVQMLLCLAARKRWKISFPTLWTPLLKKMKSLKEWIPLSPYICRNWLR